MLSQPTCRKIVPLTMLPLLRSIIGSLKSRRNSQELSAIADSHSSARIHDRRRRDGIVE
jgi:hypothetical protein